MEPLRPPPVSANPSLLPPPPLYLPYPRPPVVNPSSSTSDHQIESSDGAPKNAQPHHSGKEKEKADNGEEDKGDADKVDVDKEGADKIGTGVTGISKRTADYEGLDEPGEPVEDGEGVLGVEKAGRTGQSAGSSCCRSPLTTLDRLDRNRQN